MKRDNSQLRFFASDLMRFQGCRHATALDLRYLEQRDLVPAEESDEALLVQDHGHAHEARFLDKLQSSGRNVETIAKDDASLGDAVRLTLEALKRGPDVIAQAAFASGKWGGYADLLYRVEKPSKLGSFSYEVADTKLSRSPKPAQVLQLCLYSDMLAEVQGVAPERAFLELGNGDTFAFRLGEVAAYSRQTRRQFERFIEERPPTLPEPVAACSLCRWRDHCDREWLTTDSLVQVSGILKSQRQKIEAAGISTMAALADHAGRIPKLAPDSLEKLVAHARLQTRRKSGLPPEFERRQLEPGRGFNRLPKPDDGDLFYDIEGDPFVEGGLEYLHGVWFREGGDWRFRAFWGHDRNEEGQAAAQVLDFFAERLAAFPRAHIYHYAGYELTALRRLTKQHRTREALLDQLQRDRKFVDLYAVVSGAILASEGGYSIKDLEAFYMERAGDVATAGASIVAYEKWRETGDGAILEKIRDYNQVDCVSTQKLRDWLIEQARPTNLAWPILGEADAPIDLERVRGDEAELALLRARVEPLRTSLGEDAADLIIDLNGFHAREDKPAWWAIFDRSSQDSDDLIDDLDCLAGLEAIEPPLAVGRGTKQRRYSFPVQETKLRTGSKACIKPWDETVEATVVVLDLESGIVTLKFPGKVASPPDRLDLLPGKPIGNRVLRDAIVRMTGALVGGAASAAAFSKFLTRSAPTFCDGRTEILTGGGELPEQISAAIAAMDRSTLAIQGPPGTGKTYVSALAIADLAAQGKRIAVSSNSHKAIENLLLAIADRSAERGLSLSIAQKVTNASSEAAHPGVSIVTDNDDLALNAASVVGATAWHFARYEQPAFDYLFIDEAGQVSIANLMAMAGAAANIVLVGDPMQLPQPVQGAHPGASGLSSLEYLLDGHRVVPADRGIFLPVSRRMHSDVCRFISDAVYEGQLTNDDAAASQQLVDVSGVMRVGAHFLAVEHAGNSQTSAEEVGAISAEIDRLIGASYFDREGHERRIGFEDILVVAPYNAQVNALRSALPAAVRVGTVDKFQGQEAPICMVSMTTSSADELPRDIEFLFSLNRINVAVSRAQALALVFGSPRLLDVPCRTIDQMKLVNTLCRLAEQSQPA